MVKLLVKIAIAALLANAAYRIGSEYLAHIRFRDAVRDAAMFKAKTDDDLARRIMDLANQFDVPLDEKAIDIKREERHVLVQGKYNKPIELIPTFHYSWPFTWSIDAITSTTLPLVPPKK